MLEINEKQLLTFDNKNRARILKLIALGIIKFKHKTEEVRTMFADWMNKIPLDVPEGYEKEIKLSLKDRFAIWLLNLGG